MDWSELAITYGSALVKAIAVLIIGLWLAKTISQGLRKGMQSKGLDPTLFGFLAALLHTTLQILVVITALGMLGIEMTSFIAILAAAGLAIGMALSGTLQNFAGGVMVLIFKPYKVGDLITAHGHTGTVREISIFTTNLTGLQNRNIIIPNGPLFSGDIINYTTLGIIRVDMTFGIGYGEDIRQAKDVLLKVMKEHPKVLDDPAPFVGVNELGDSSVNLAVRPYALPEHYWDVHFDIYEQGKYGLDEAGIEIPFPQLDIHQRN